MHHQYFLGVDGGGTKTTCCAISAAQMQQQPSPPPTTITTTSESGGSTIKALCVAKSGSSNHNSVGKAAAKSNIAAAVNDVINQLGCTFDQIGGICLGMAGVDRPDDIQMVHEWMAEILDLKKHPHIQVFIYNDAVAALSAGTLGKLCGIVVISGTGMISLGFNAKGESVRSGGWGALLGDVGSGYQIGDDILVAVARAADGRGPPTMLQSAVLSKLGLSIPSDIIKWMYGDLAWHRVAELAPLAFECERAGDDIASEIVARNAKGLAECIRAVATRLNVHEPDECIVVLQGGLLTHENSRLAAVLQNVLKQDLPHLRVVLPKVAPEVGAALLALNKSQPQQQNANL